MKISTVPSIASPSMLTHRDTPYPSCYRSPQSRGNDEIYLTPIAVIKPAFGKNFSGADPLFEKGSRVDIYA
jgi:hypothetical protein